MQHNWSLLRIGMYRVTLYSLTMSRQHAWWLAGYMNETAIANHRDFLWRAVPLPMTGDVSDPVFVEISQ